MKDNETDHFSFYLESLNIKNDQNVLTLTSQYYYNLDEIRHIHTLIHVKELNKVHNIHKLMSDMMRTLSNGTQFIGCFVDNKIHNKGKIGLWLSNIIDMKDGGNYVSRKQMIKIFFKYGLKIVDITEINGMTYFCVKRH